MLGLTLTKNSWTWGACGKHPLARDFFYAGPKDPFIQAVADWVKNGYQRLDQPARTGNDFCSWRFWARGQKKGSLSCGVIRDSSDSIGRPFPLMIMGSGPLKGWEEKWDFLPKVCEETWGHMEYMAAKRFGGFEQFEKDLKLIKPPSTKWAEISSGAVGASAQSCNDMDVEKMTASLSQDKAVVITLANGVSTDPNEQAVAWHCLLKSRISDVPSSVFMGGASAGTSMVVFARALAVTDFIRLWSGGNIHDAVGDGVTGAVGGHDL